uniref:Uncharacterized protein n=1 Tax=Electrophorus electricus TaxID=8005 RepID=A0A4W4HC42_ELEEL
LAGRCLSYRGRRSRATEGGLYALGCPSGPKPVRAFRRQPYPPAEDRQDVRRQPYPPAEDRQDAHHEPESSLYQKLYQQFCGDEAKCPADCVVLSVNNRNLEYPKSLGHCLQERGLSVEMLFLQAESGLTRALQDVRSDGSPLCILVEQTNVTLSSCTVIIFSESLKIHRNMPKEQAMEFVTMEFGRLGGGRRPRDPAEAGVRATELMDDYLERAKLERHAVPFTTRHLLFLMAEGLHLYPEELATVAEYVRGRQDHLQGGYMRRGEHTNSYPKTKPPPLLSVSVLQGSPHRSAAVPRPTPRGPSPPHGPPALHGPSASHPPPFGPPASRGPPPAHGLTGLRGPPALHGPRQGSPGGRGPTEHGPLAFHQPCGPPQLRGPPSQNGPSGLRGVPPPHGTRTPPPSLLSLHMGNAAGETLLSVLSTQGGLFSQLELEHTWFDFILAILGNAWTESDVWSLPPPQDLFHALHDVCSPDL